MTTKIIYLLGAGASYGTRENGKLVRGVPVVNELENTIRQLIYDLEGEQSASEEARNRVIKLLEWLANKCKEFPTIDTYAKLLYVTKQEDEYKKLKNALSLFFTLLQITYARDLRYDGFIASLINENRKFPDKMKILSWNYDSQFELAFGEYISPLTDTGRHITRIWKELNTSDKLTAKSINDDFGIVKLNGSATSLYPNYHGSVDRLVDLFYPLFAEGEDEIVVCDRIFISKEYEYRNTLSFAWEQEQGFFENIAKKIKEVTTLVVIGYSFPYVNREIDRMLFQCMPNLETIYIQDREPRLIQENIEATMSDSQKSFQGGIDFRLRINLNQFVIPSEL